MEVGLGLGLETSQMEEMDDGMMVMVMEISVNDPEFLGFRGLGSPLRP